MKQLIKYKVNLFTLWFKYVLIGYPIQRDVYRMMILNYSFNKQERWIFNRISVKD